jgi:phage terminase large subunit-like protein
LTGISAEVYGSAADRQQASIVFDVAKQMVEMSSLGYTVDIERLRDA